MVAVALLLIWALFSATPEGKDDKVNRREELKRRAAEVAKRGGSANNAAPKPKYGDEIFENADSPRSWDDYIGQAKAKQMLRIASASAKVRNERMSHVMIASGMPGIGKSAIARLLASSLGVGVTEIQGTVSKEMAHDILVQMKDGDVLIWDEFHQALTKGKANAEWLLPFLQDGTIPTPEGLKAMPRVTVVAATTDLGVVPETILSRFPIRPVLESYSDDEYRIIARNASKFFIEKEGLNALTEKTISDIAKASTSPRLMKAILGNLRDCEIVGVSERDPEGNCDMSITLDMMGITEDGLDTDAVDYLLNIYTLTGGKSPSGIQTLMAALNITERPILTEAVLIQRGYLTIDKSGRALTEDGVSRVLEMVAA